MSRLATNPARAPRALIWIGLAMLAGVGVFLARHATTGAGGSDTSGYLNNARLLAAGKLQDELRLPAEFKGHPETRPQHFMPLGMDLVVPGNPHLPPTYAVGLPLQLAAAAKLFGWDAGTLLVELALALAALWFCYTIAREMEIDPWLAASGSFIVGLFPVFWFTSIQPLSDTPALTWCLATVWTALRSRRHAGWAVACGAALAMAVMVRATNAVMVPALVLLLTPGWRRLAWAVTGGLPGAVALGYYNHTLYGGALRSGYGPTLWEAFAASYGTPTAVHFGYWLAVLLPTPLLMLPALAWWRARSRELTALTLWFAGIVGVYLFYEVSRQTWWCLRFILPAVPALVIVGLLGLNALPARFRLSAAVLLVGWAITSTCIWNARLHPLRIAESERVYREACKRARVVFPRGALVASFATSGALYFHTDFAILRADQIGPADFARYAALARTTNQPICALLFDGFDDTLRIERLPGNWEKLDRVKNVTLWRLVSSP